jgi:UDP-N-acetylglucosamine 2-epimerase (non-hydrolysing)
VKLLHVVGARPNVPKLAPVYRAAARARIEQVVVHTGQHYDAALSESFFRDLGMPSPDINLGVGSASHARQTARMMERIESVITGIGPDWLLVYGDVNSTVAAALVACKLGVRIAHVEAGLRSHDRSMPEEINRIVTDRLADLLLTPSRDADETLRAEGEPEEEICFVGNTMVDSLLRMLPLVRRSDGRGALGSGSQVVVTLHRPSNVDDSPRLTRIAAALKEIATHHPVVFPAHPRTRKRMAEAGLDLGRVQVLSSISYLEMLKLVDQAHAVITDSGGLQEETTVLGVPCLTLRENTERPITIQEGTNCLVPDPSDLPGALSRVSSRTRIRRPEGWDGHAAERIVAALQTRERRHRAGAVSGARVFGEDSSLRAAS